MFSTQAHPPAHLPSPPTMQVRRCFSAPLLAPLLSHIQPLGLGAPPFPAVFSFPFWLAGLNVDTATKAMLAFAAECRAGGTRGRISG